MDQTRPRTGLETRCPAFGVYAVYASCPKLFLGRLVGPYAFVDRTSGRWTHRVPGLAQRLCAVVGLRPHRGGVKRLPSDDLPINLLHARLAVVLNSASQAIAPCVSALSLLRKNSLCPSPEARDLISFGCGDRDAMSTNASDAGAWSEALTEETNNPQPLWT
ncbi:hypothetical protein DPX16_8393 [Anabarilius grahami]|uniref:Uncharacterized protein n=1 Tax=Anabarilius grahami TaxID=495550 RepID=A0A3N0Z2X2_ANAGA|nr:hypothetical protein DPX16_8393 [Anabarilius grahami]